MAGQVMAQLQLGAAVLLLATVAVGLGRVWRGPTRADRMLAVQLYGTSGVAVLILLAQATGQPSLLDVALVFALLAAITTVAFVRRTGRAGAEEKPSG